MRRFLILVLLFAAPLVSGLAGEFDLNYLVQHLEKTQQMLVEDAGYQGWGNPIKFSRSGFTIRHRPPGFGAHGRELLAEFGFDAGEVERLIAEGVVLESRQK